MLVLGTLAVIGAAYLGLGAFSKLQTEGFDDPSSESSRAAQVLERDFGGDADFVFLLSADGPGVDATSAHAAGAALTERLRHDPDLTHVVSYFDADSDGLRSRDGRSALVTANLSDTADEDSAAGDVVDRYSGDRGGLDVRIGGQEGVSQEVAGQIGQDLGLAESIAIPLILVLLLLAFGNVVGALITLTVGMIAILGTFGELSVLGGLTDVSIYSINLTTGLGLGLAVDYGLLMVARVREERAAGRTGEEAVVRAVETAGRTIVFSAVTVTSALAAMLIFPLYFLRSFAYAGIGVMVITAASAVVLLPAALTLLDHRVDAWRLPRIQGIRGGETPFWARLAAFVQRRPVVAAAPVLALLLLAASPLLGISFGTPDDRVLPASADSRQVGDMLRQDFAGDETTAIEVVTTAPVGNAALTTYAAQVAQLPGVVRVETATARDSARVSAVTGLDRRSKDARVLVAEIRDLPGPAGVETLVGGPTAELADSLHAIGSRLPYALGWMALATFVILFLFTGSVVQPLRALVLNAVSMSATVGAMVWVFQRGHLSGLLGFTPMPMDTSMTVLLFTVAFGLSMDYEVFVLGRVKEMHDLGHESRAAVVHGLSRTGRIVTTAAALIAISFFAFLVSDVAFIQLFGLGTGLAILVDATLVRGVLLPASMRLLGDAAWWAPAPLRALHRRFGLSETPTVDAAPPIEVPA
ncbi:putative drug exporter of the RND superfamily [Marmoricola sp. URHA0025 HA25]